MVNNHAADVAILNTGPLDGPGVLVLFIYYKMGVAMGARRASERRICVRTTFERACFFDLSLYRGRQI